MRVKGNSICFDNDDEFYTFAVEPGIVIRETESGIKYSDVNFTKAYNKAIEENKSFIICDENSLVAKRQCISVGVITKYIQNLEDYYGEQFIR